MSLKHFLFGFQDAELFFPEQPQPDVFPLHRSEGGLQGHWRAGKTGEMLLVRASLLYKYFVKQLQFECSPIY